MTVKRASGIGAVALALAGAGLLAALVPAGSAQSPPPTTTTDTTATTTTAPTTTVTTTTHDGADDDHDAEAQAEAGPEDAAEGRDDRRHPRRRPLAASRLRGRPRGLQLAARPPGRSAQGRGEPRRSWAPSPTRRTPSRTRAARSRARRSRSASTSTAAPCGGSSPRSASASTAQPVDSKLLLRNLEPFITKGEPGKKLDRTGALGRDPARAAREPPHRHHAARTRTSTRRSLAPPSAP